MSPKISAAKVENKSLDARLLQALKEDRAREDVTSRALIPAQEAGEADFIARASGVLCGIAVAERCFRLFDPQARFERCCEDGAELKRGAVIARVRGRLRSLFAVERVALNLLCRLSGIATLTSQFVRQASPYGVRIFDTRKTTPLWRDLEKYAVATGGGCNHRQDLASACFIKDNHVDACGGIRAALERLFSMKKVPRPVIIEARTPKEVMIASKYPVDLILLDNMSPQRIRNIFKVIDKGIEMEISGGVNLENVREYARTGVSRISIGALTHSAKALDIALDYRR